MPESKKAAPKKPGLPPDARAAYLQIENEFALVAEADFVTINVDIPQAVSLALGALEGLAPLRAAIVEQLPKHSIATFDKLGTYALAAWYSHLLFLNETAPKNTVKELTEEAAPLRANLLRDAEAAAGRGLVPSKTVEEIRSGQGNIDTANDLVALSALFSDNWKTLQGKTAATEKEVARAGELGALLLSALGAREQVGTVTLPSTERRVRAFTLFMRAYNETRRAVHYLRWHEGDADDLAPSLYKGRGGRGAKAEEALPEAAQQAAPVEAGSSQPS
ncbi:MAG: hypothetical protein IPM54_09355 [Polyangiaceae bacterium]|nr:hypothetical protein [Polyangiaceae bacterium]